MEAANPVPAIVGIRPDSPASKGGLRRGDILLSINGREVATYDHAVNAFFHFLPGKTARFTILRGTKKLDLTVVPQANPAKVKAE